MKKVLFLCVLGYTTYAQGQDSLVQENYFEKYAPLAIQEMVRTGVPAAITLAQGYLESSAGQSKLAHAANNHFGIKAGSDWNGPYFLKDDDRKNDHFRKYHSVEESYLDHSDFLKTRRRYDRLFTLDPTDYKSWAKGLKNAGYATDVRYASKLIDYIEKFHLYEYTKKTLILISLAISSR